MVPSFPPINPEPRIPICMFLLPNFIGSLLRQRHEIVGSSADSAQRLHAIRHGIARHGPFPSSQQTYRRAFPQWRCASWLWLAWRHANASHPAGSRPTSPGRIWSIGPPQRCAKPQPAVTIRIWPSGWVCQAVRAPGSNATLAPRVCAGSGGSNRGSMRTVPVKYSAGPLEEGSEPILLISISSFGC